MMKRTGVLAGALIIAFLAFRADFDIIKKSVPEPLSQSYNKELSGVVNKGETLFDIFKKYNLDLSELFKIKEVSGNIHRLKDLHPGQSYKIIVDNNNHINSLVYWINDDDALHINRVESGFCAEKKSIEYTKTLNNISGIINDNLVSSLSEDRGGLMLALQLSDIFAWDIDFSSDLRKGDTFKIIVEALHHNGELRKYGEIVAAEFSNDGKTYQAFGFELNNRMSYYDADGNSLKKAFLKAPLSFRRISSSFAKGRLHPILKIYRPHHGLDYAAASGTPVSSVGDGTIIFKGRKGQYGNLVIVKHKNSWLTYYGHLSRFAKNIKKGNIIEQGDLVGYVGATGMATGPHLHYEVRVNGKAVNPLTIKMPNGEPVPVSAKQQFTSVRENMQQRLAAIDLPVNRYAKK